MGRDPADVGRGDPGRHSLRVTVDARLEDGRAGGVQQFVIGLASALSDLDDGDEDYLFLGLRDHAGWLSPYLSGDARLISAVVDERAGTAASVGRRLRSTVGRRLPGLRGAWRRIANAPRVGTGDLATSDGRVEAAGAEVMHFTFQDAFITEIPSLYQPWDLQHVHLPGFFTPAQRGWRDAAYRTFSQRAQTVVVASRWAKEDIVRHLGLAPTKVAIVEVPAVVEAYPTPDAEKIELIRRKFDLPPRFVYYPAQTWQHKNHVRLIEALALLRDRDGIVVDLVCSGVKTEHFPEIQAAVRRLRLDGGIRFLGFVEPIEVQALYRLARCLVFPSLFEGWGLPVVEAFFVGLPVACSNVTSLPDLVGDAALLFDPLDVDAIAAAISRLWQDDGLVDLLVARGRGTVARLEWPRAARTYRAHYRAVAGRSLTAEDRQLLAHSFRGADA